VPHRRRLEAQQAHPGLIAAAHGRQRMPRRAPQPRLQAIAPHRRHDRDQRALDRRALEVAQLVAPPHACQQEKPSSSTAPSSSG
jgi:hypothetical protein